eukprot:44543-Prorocentrum_minimum.AAC.1
MTCTAERYKAGVMQTTATYNAKTSFLFAPVGVVEVLVHLLVVTRVVEHGCTRLQKEGLATGKERILLVQLLHRRHLIANALTKRHCNVLPAVVEDGLVYGVKNLVYALQLQTHTAASSSVRALYSRVVLSQHLVRPRREAVGEYIGRE